MRDVQASTKLGQVGGVLDRPHGVGAVAGKRKHSTECVDEVGLTFEAGAVDQCGRFLVAHKA
ncbi:hypothetical protein AJ87_45820 [Rhizobium yanglingense]|nr:hypothetical protein AJ87_45820 [Rhizobium yanglingense]